MTDRNPMLQNLNNPVAGLGIVPGKGLLDDNEVHHRQRNARNPMRAAFCYPGGDDPINHNIEVGDLLFGKRGQRDVEEMDGEPNELVTGSVSGLCWDDYNTHDAMEEDYYFVGVAAGDESLERPFDGGTDGRGGHGTIRVGTVSVINTGNKTFYPGDLVMWKYPDCGNTPGSSFYNKMRMGSRNMSIVDGGDPDNPGINMRARYGQEITKFRPEIVPFNPTDFSIQLGGVFSTMFLPMSEGGVSDVPFNNLLSNTADYQGGTDLTLAQESGLSYKHGLLGVFSALLECCVLNGIVELREPEDNTPLPKAKQANAITESVLKKMGAFSTDSSEQGILIDGMSDVFLKHIGGADALQEAALKRFVDSFGSNPYDVAVVTPDSTNIEQMHARMRLNAVGNLTRGISKTVDSKRSKIIGRCTSASAPGDTTDILLGHTI